MWRVMDVILLLFDVIVGIGLAFKAPWSVIAYIVGIILLQIVPYTAFPEHFAANSEQAATLGGMVWVQFGLLILLAIFLWPKPRDV